MFSYSYTLIHRTITFTKPSAQIIPRLASTLDCAFLAEVGTIRDAVVDGAEFVVCPPPCCKVVVGGIVVLRASSTDIALLIRLSSVVIQAISVGKMVGFKAGQVIGLLWESWKYQRQLSPHGRLKVMETTKVKLHLPIIVRQQRVDANVRSMIVGGISSIGDLTGLIQPAAPAATAWGSTGESISTKTVAIRERWLGGDGDHWKQKNNRKNFEKTIHGDCKPNEQLPKRNNLLRLQSYVRDII